MSMHLVGVDTFAAVNKKERVEESSTQSTKTSITGG